METQHQTNTSQRGRWKRQFDRSITPKICVKDSCAPREDFLISCFSTSFYLLAKSREVHHHSQTHEGDECGVECHNRKRSAGCELLHWYYCRINHRAGAVYGSRRWCLVTLDYYLWSISSKCMWRRVSVAILWISTVYDILCTFSHRGTFAVIIEQIMYSKTTDKNKNRCPSI